MALNDEARAVLNDLIEICRDGANGFRTAVGAVKDPDVGRLFESYAAQRQSFAAELEGEVRRLGEEPPRAGSVTAALHRGWMNLKAALTRQEDDALIEEAERGEEVAKAAYEKALAVALPEGVQDTVRRQYLRVKEAHDQVRFMRRAA